MLRWRPAFGLNTQMERKRKSSRFLRLRFPSASSNGVVTRRRTVPKPSNPIANVAVDLLKNYLFWRLPSMRKNKKTRWTFRVHRVSRFFDWSLRLHNPLRIPVDYLITTRKCCTHMGIHGRPINRIAVHLIPLGCARTHASCFMHCGGYFGGNGPGKHDVNFQSLVKWLVC